MINPNPNSQVFDVGLSSPSLLSEPPNIKNWFSSYTYQSPALDSNEDFCVSPTRVDEGECEDKGLYVEDSEDEKVENYVHVNKSRRAHRHSVGRSKKGCKSIAQIPVEEAVKIDFVHDVEIPGCSDSLPLLSEPPDIANWFSSYAYESPELDSADFDVTLKPNQTSNNSEKADHENNRSLKELTAKVKVELPSSSKPIPNSSEITARSSGTKNTLYSAAQKHISEGTGLSSMNTMCPIITSEVSIQESALGDCCITSDESAQCQRTTVENLKPIIQEGLQTSEADQLTHSTKALHRAKTCQNKTISISKVSDSNSGWIQLNHKTRKADNFASSVKNSAPRINDENSPQKFGARNYKFDRNTTSASSFKHKKAGEMTREVFKETTNNQVTYAQESAGKWRCPQKNKPNSGPPLKQLRLEKWVHRI